MEPINDTAGQAHPYWYEWFVGLIEVVNLLNPDTNIDSVAFQVASIKGWDDVVVKHLGGTRYYQIKHTRENNTLKFGDLVSLESNGKSLLANLFLGAKESGIIKQNNDLIIYTNRKDGTSWSNRKNGDKRPPLLEFWNWHKSVITENSLADIKPPPEYRNAWNEWLACFDEQLDDGTEFLRLLSIRTKEDDLDDLEIRICNELATAFGISNPLAIQLFETLCRNLRKWTTGHLEVRVEAVHNALAQKSVPRDYSPAPPPPSPFFPTRLPIAEQLEKELLSDIDTPIYLLTGEPGSGKTSAVSWLANRREDNPFEGIIGIRFFCFEPIRPDKPFISPDDSRVDPKDLWFSLLFQLRRGLRGRLHELEVPVRNTFLTWQEARQHVLRLADILGRELGRRFVISIDGIDHASRSAQANPEKIAAFFSSLPSPDEIASKRIRILIAGQPPEHFHDSYPTWLVNKNSKIRRIDLPKLEHEDIESLLNDTSTDIDQSQLKDMARLIDSFTAGNTLSVVFAVAEAELCNSLEDLKTRLTERSLSDGMWSYYDSIWQHALHGNHQLSCSLAAMISLARTPVAAEQLSSIFNSWEKPTPWWGQVLADLGPLLTRKNNEYIIRHNDVRVFLTSKFWSYCDDDRENAASQMVDHYLKPTSNRLAAHFQLFDLYKLANRTIETASVFSVDWVLEGITLGIDMDQLIAEGDMAASELSSTKNWDNVVEISCALQSLYRAREYSDYVIETEKQHGDSPPFLQTEASVRPISQWSTEEFGQLIQDADELASNGEKNRARALLERWLVDLTIDEIVRKIPDISNNSEHFGQRDGNPRLGFSRSYFESLGALSVKLNWKVQDELDNDSTLIEQDAVESFEKGFIVELTKEQTVASIDDFFSLRKPLFFKHHEMTIRNLAETESWGLVAECLQEFQRNRERYSKEFLLEATWYALRAGLPEESEWITYINNPFDVLPNIPNHVIGEDLNFIQLINMSSSWGWTNSGMDAGDIANVVFGAFDSTSRDDSEDAIKLMFRAAAVIGAIEKQRTSQGLEPTFNLYSPDQLGTLLRSLWGDVTYKSYSLNYKAHLLSNKVAGQLANQCRDIGAEFDTAALQAALPLAQELVRGPRVEAIWNVLKRHKHFEVLRKWASHYISNEGIVWSWAPNDTRETVKLFVPLAKSIGLIDLSNEAETRANKLIIGYKFEKEYSFEPVLSWFSEIANKDPSIWKKHGWKLWELTRICEEKNADNIFKSKTLSAIYAAALRDSGLQGWWNLASTTVDKKTDWNWHTQTRTQFVDGCIEAFKQGFSIDDATISQIWSIAVSLSYWTDARDTKALVNLKERLISHSPDDSKNVNSIKMQAVCPVVSSKEIKATRQTKSEAAELSSEDSYDEQMLWDQIDNQLAEVSSDDRKWSYPELLLSIAHRHAILAGSEALIRGLDIQLDMHVRWSLGGVVGDTTNIPAKLSEMSANSVDDIFIEFIEILLNGHSAEVTVAALEGLHLYVDHNPDIILQLFSKFSGEISTRWLVRAAEPWATLYPESVHRAHEKISALISDSDLDCRLDAWIVLLRNADILDIAAPKFPLPDKPELTNEEIQNAKMRLLHAPAIQRGAYHHANRFSTISNLLARCEFLGLDMSDLEGVVAEQLTDFPHNSNVNLLELGPHRHGDFMYSAWYSEIALGNSVLSAISQESFTDEDIANLCTAILSNEDSWVFRSRPRSIVDLKEWPRLDEYSKDSFDLVKQRQIMLDVAKSAQMHDGWSILAARVQDYTYNKDFDLNVWLQFPTASSVFANSKPITCPSGRTFFWWISKPPSQGYKQFVTGEFVGGYQRLPHCHLEIQIPTKLCNIFEWTPNPLNPFEFTNNGDVVARYERIHGELRDHTNGSGYRQPIIDRWIVSSTGLKQIKSKYKFLREQYTFNAFTSKE